MVAYECKGLWTPTGSIGTSQLKGTYNVQIYHTILERLRGEYGKVPKLEGCIIDKRNSLR